MYLTICQQFVTNSGLAEDAAWVTVRADVVFTLDFYCNFSTFPHMIGLQKSGKILKLDHRRPAFSETAYSAPKFVADSKKMHPKMFT